MISESYRCILLSYSNVIDVGALDTHNLEQHEYMDRSRAYSRRIESGRIKLPETSSCLLKDIPAPERILAADPLAVEDQELVRNCFQLFTFFIDINYYNSITFNYLN